MIYEADCLYCAGSGRRHDLNGVKCSRCVEGKVLTPDGETLIDLIKRHLTDEIEDDITCLQDKMMPNPHRKFK